MLRLLASGREVEYAQVMFPATTSRNSIPGTQVKVGGYTDAVTGVLAKITNIYAVHGDQVGVYVITVSVGGNLISDTFCKEEFQ